MLLVNKDGSRSKYVQMLIDGLNSTNFREYIDLIVVSLSSELNHWDNLCWYPNDEEALESIYNICYCSYKDFARRIKDSDYNPYDDFVSLDTFETKTYSELRELYLEILEGLSSDYEYELECVLKDTKDELIELSENL